MMQEQQRAVDERQRQFVATILERRAGQTPTATRSTTEKSPPIKIDFKEFSGEPEDRTTWCKVHRAQLSVLGCTDALTETAGDETKVNRDDFDRDSVDPDQLHKAQQAWVSLVTSCKGVAFNIVSAQESATEAWAKLVQHYQASGLKERRRLTIDSYMTKMELGEHPRKFLLRIDQMVKELERVDRPVDPKDIDIIILSGLTPQYDAKVRMLESSSDWPTREWIERAVINQYERLESEKSAAGSRAMLSASAHRHNDTPPTRCPLCSRTGHSALKCREFQITRREKKPNGFQRDGEHGGNGVGGSNGGGSRNGEGGGSGRGGKSGGVGGNRGGGGSKNHSRGGGKQKKSGMDFESGDKTPCPDCCFCLEPHKTTEYPNHSAFATTPATPSSQHGGSLGSVRTNLEAGLLVASSTRPALAARGAPRKRHEDKYWVADNGATENMTQDSSHLEDYTPAPQDTR